MTLALLRVFSNQAFLSYCFVPDVIVGRNDMPSQQSNAELDEPRAVGFHLVGNRADERAGTLAHLGESLGNAILTDDGEVRFAACLPRRVENAESA